MIGPYRVGTRLGAGGMATVYRATQLALDREVALKVVSPQFAADPGFRARFLREAQLSARINHPHVVTCYDAGAQDGLLYMALELVTGGDLLGLLARRGGKLDATLALTLLRDAFHGLEAVEAGGLIHRDLKPANIFLTDRGQAKLADLGLARPQSGDDRTTQAGMIMGTPAYMPPEQAQGANDLDIRADLYALGATLYHLLTGRPPFHADNPVATLMKVINEPVPDPRALNAEVSAPLAAFVQRLMAKSPNARPASAHAARTELEGLLTPAAGPTPQRTPRPNDVAVPTPARPTPTLTPRAATPSNSPVPAPSAIAKNRPTPITTPRPPSAPIGLNDAQMGALVKRIVIEKDGSKAALILAPGANFPRFLLEKILESAGIVHGLLPNALTEATRPSSVPRRIVLAKSDEPSPGVPGRSVLGERIEPLAQALVIRISEDGMSAIGYCLPNQLCPPTEVEREVKLAGLRYGLEQATLRRLVEGPAFGDGRAVVARGRAMQPILGEHFALSVDAANAEAAANLQFKPVTPGTVLAVWSPGQPGKAGMDVLGREVKPRPPEPRTPEECAGEGTELGRDRDGRMVLRATRTGCCQQQLDGAVRVVGILEIPGDLGPDHPPIDTDDLVVVRGTVKAGASITSSSDIVVMGDLEDAQINAGGSLSISGEIRSGDQELAVAGTVQAGSLGVRTVMAGEVRISGTVKNGQIQATGAIRVGRVIGGQLTAGGDVQADVVGDKDGTTTELWAGHHLTYAQQAKLAKLAERRVEAERSRLLADCRIIESEVAASDGRAQRMGAKGFARDAALATNQARLERLRQEQERLRVAAEQSRLELMRSRQMATDLGNKGDNAGARITVNVVAHEGAVMKLADLEPETLGGPRLKYRLEIR